MHIQSFMKFINKELFFLCGFNKSSRIVQSLVNVILIIPLNFICCCYLLKYDLFRLLIPLIQLPRGILWGNGASYSVNFLLHLCYYHGRIFLIPCEAVVDWSFSSFQSCPMVFNTKIIKLLTDSCSIACCVCRVLRRVSGARCVAMWVMKCMTYGNPCRCHGVCGSRPHSFKERN